MKCLNQWEASRGTPDVVGIGALNVDYVAPSSQLKRLGHDFMEELPSYIEHGSEHVMDGRDLDIHLARLAPFTTPYPGGSAFNSIHCIRELHTGITTGYVGVAGDTYDVSFADYFKDLDIDGRFVVPIEAQARRCLSFTRDGERTLLTEREDLSNLVEVLQPVSTALVEYLAGARIIHVTALTNDADTKFVSDLVLTVRRRFPAIRLSVDPGLIWAKAAVGTPPSSAVCQLLAEADFLFLNPQEFDVLARRLTDTRLESVRKLLPKPPSRQRLLIGKQLQSTDLYSWIGNEVLPRSYPHGVVPEGQIEDSTGAGDVFAGAFIAGAVLGLDYSERSALAYRLVEAKLRGSGCAPYRRFSSLLTLGQAVPDAGRERDAVSPPRSTYNFFGSVGSVQTGTGAVAKFVQNLNGYEMQALVDAVHQIRSAVTSAIEMTEQQRCDLRDVADECEQLVQSDSPNNTKLMAMFTLLAGSVQAIPSAQPAYQALRAALVPLGITLP